MVVKLTEADVIHESQQPFFFSDVNHFLQQEEGIEKPLVCKSCPFATAKFAVDDPPPPNGGTTDVLVIFPSPFWADIQTGPTIPGYKKNTQVANKALEGPFRSKNWWLYRKILGYYQHHKQQVFRTTYGALCRTRGAPPANVTKYCAQHYLSKKIEVYKPKVILALGINSAKALGFKQSMRDLRGTVRQYETTNISVPVIFSHDPSLYFFSNKEYALLSTFILDLEKAIAIGSQGFNPVDWSEIRDKCVTIPKTDAEVKAAIEPLIDNAEIRLAFDIETTGLDPRADDAKVTAISFAWADNKALAYSLEKASPERWAITRQLLESSTRKIAHNSKFDIGYLLGKEGIRVQALMADTMLNQYLYDENRGGADDSATIRGEYTLKKLVWDYMWQYGGYEELGDVAIHLKKHGSTEGLDEDDLLFYAALDSLMTWKLHRIQSRLLNDLPVSTSPEEFRKNRVTKLCLFSHTFMCEAVTTLAEIENIGIKLDTALLNQMSQNAAEEIKECEERFKKQVAAAGRDPEQVNMRSTKDLQDLLFNVLDLPIVKKTKTGRPSTDSATLAALNDEHEIIQTLSHYRKLEKLKKSFLDNWKDAARDGIVYPRYHLGNAKTGRTSCSHPNVQQVPGTGNMLPGYNLKRLFIPRMGKVLLYADYSQQEVRVLASYCGEGKLMDALNKGLDVHSFTCSEIFGIPYEEVHANKDKEPYKSKRSKAKNVTFSMVYGGTAYTLWDRYDIDMEEGNHLLQIFYQKFPEIREYVEASHRMAQKKKYVTSCFNRRRNFPILYWKRSDNRAFRQAQNSRIQSTASDITLDAVMYLQKKLPSIGGSVLLTVHDSIIAEVPWDTAVDGVKLFYKGMIDRPQERYSWLKAPMVIDIEAGLSWGELNKLGESEEQWRESLSGIQAKVNS